MKTDLTLEDLDVIQTSLSYSRLKIENYQYVAITPEDAYEMRRRRLSEIAKAQTKVSVLRQILKGA